MSGTDNTRPQPPMGGDVASVMSALDSAVTNAAAVSWWGVSDAELLRRTIELETTRRKFEATRLTLVGELSARNLAVETGARSTAAWLTDKTGVSRSDARSTVQTASRLSSFAPASREAIAQGSISVEHAKVVARVMWTLHNRSLLLDSPITAEIKARAEATLLELAATLEPGQLEVAGHYLIEQVDPDSDTPTDDERAMAEEEMRQLRINRRPDGSGSFHGEFDPEGMAMLEAGLRPRSARRPKTAEGPDIRKLPRRQADALLEIVQLALTNGGHLEDGRRSGGGTGATLFVHTGFETLQDQLAQSAPTLDSGVELSPESVRRMACDAFILPAVMATTSQPLDIGRATRVIPAGMRRALIARDRHCAFPGCATAAAWSQGHHVIFWANGGPTALSNLVLLCPHHHRVIHHTDWTVQISADGLPEFTPPDWLTADIAIADPTWRITLQERFPRLPSAS